MESFGEETEEGVKNRNMYLFYQDVCRNHALHVYAIDSSSLSMYPLTKLPRVKMCDMGYIAHGSKLYAIGGVFNDYRVKKCPRDVFVCNISKRKGSGGEYEWKAGPLLNAGKPYPMVVAVKGEIYALAGHADHNVLRSPAAIDPTFEFLDHRGIWYPLPNPPFYSWYSTPPGPKLLCYTVSGNIIYVLVQKPDNDAVEILYSFNVLRNKWMEHPNGGFCSDPVGDKLSSHKWFKRADLEDNKLYLSEAYDFSCRLYVHDFTSKRKKKIVDKIVSDASACEIDHGVPVSWDVESCVGCGYNGVPYVHLPVKLMKIMDGSKQSLVAHIGNQMLLVVCTYDPPPKFPYNGRFVYTCLLKLVKKENTCEASCRKNLRDCAVIVKQKYHKINSRFYNISEWSTM